MLKQTALACAFLALVGAPAVAKDAPAAKPAKAAEKLVPAGEPVNCVRIANIRSTNVIDDKTIDFEMNNRAVYRNHLPNGCSGLGFAKAFSYKNNTGNLCSVDIITVVDTGSAPLPGAKCGLGKFTPMKASPKADAAKAE